MQINVILVLIIQQSLLVNQFASAIQINILMKMPRNASNVIFNVKNVMVQIIITAPFVNKMHI